jgi:hypothetical protein
VEHGEDERDVGIFLGRGDDVEVVGLDEGEGALGGLDDWRDEALLLWNILRKLGLD